MLNSHSEIPNKHVLRGRHVDNCAETLHHLTLFLLLSFVVSLVIDFHASLSFTLKIPSNTSSISPSFSFFPYVLGYIFSWRQRGENRPLSQALSQYLRSLVNVELGETGPFRGPKGLGC